MSVIAVSGVDGALRRRIVDALETVVDRVVTFDPSNENERAEFSTVETVVHLAFVEDLNQTAFHTVLEQPSGNLKKVVLVSSAMVYGAWPNNAIPLSEDAPVRPNPETSFAVHQADAERKLMEWSDESTSREIAILRPAAVASSIAAGLIGEALLAAAPIRTGRDDPPVQFLHLDDLATAVRLVVVENLCGVFNVAPDGWLSSRELRELLGARPKVRIPVPLPGRLDRYISRRVAHNAPSGLLPYTRYSWVVANDLLKAHGWTPKYGNDQVFVTADAGMPWDSMNAKQRQLVSLSVGLTSVFGAIISLVLWVKRVRRR